MTAEISHLPAPIDAEVEDLRLRLDREARAGGYNLNPDVEFTRDLVRGLIVNERRYGYQACPCRLASGEKDEDLDIICPCDYRDADLDDFDACYCGLYVSGAVARGEKAASSIPDRRPTEDERRKGRPKVPDETAGREERHSARGFALPVWRCKVCGYLCARDGPPEVCPICKAKRERFERFA
jgi:ferredoxin-thioredoxin reductase catalytic chain